MKRKEFLKKTVQMGLATGSMMLVKGKKAQARSSERKIEKQESKSRPQRFKEEWLKSLLKHMDEQFDEKTRVKLMEACGRDCARRGSIRMAEASKGDVGKLVNTLANYLGKENSRMEGKVVHLTYSKCYCQLVADGPERLSDTYCFCSKGWVLEMFETAAQKPVKVELLQTIKRGAPSCKFLIRL
jgi:predicted hydrocarbon binding protein